MKKAVEYLEYMWTLQGAIYKNDIYKALEMENELLLHVIKCYHNNLFFVPLNENGEAEAILELILSGQIKSKLDI